jgi:hypothetical protein
MLLIAETWPSSCPFYFDFRRLSRKNLEEHRTLTNSGLAIDRR